MGARARRWGWLVATSLWSACVGQPPSPPEQATSEATTTGGEATSTSGGVLSTSDGNPESTERGDSETTMAADSSTSAADPCELVSCPAGEECVDGQCTACTEPSCGACRGNQTCECPLDDSCCEVGTCVDFCDPILQDCLAGEGCYPTEELLWVCAPDESGAMGTYGDPCEHGNACDPGLVCVGGRVVPGCEAMVGCCSEVCDIADPAGSAQCSGAGGGQVCTPVYERGTAPAGLENVGVCALPP